MYYRRVKLHLWHKYHKTLLIIIKMATASDTGVFQKTDTKQNTIIFKMCEKTFVSKGDSTTNLCHHLEKYSNTRWWLRRFYATENAGCGHLNGVFFQAELCLLLWYTEREKSAERQSRASGIEHQLLAFSIKRAPGWSHLLTTFTV